MSDTDKHLLLDIIPKMEGWLSPLRACEMYDLVLMVKPKVVVEIGVFGGRSLISQALALKFNGSGKIYGIDPWKKEAAIEGDNDQQNKDWWGNHVNLHKVHTDAMGWIWTLGLDKFVNVIRAASQDCHECIPPIDILYIDGNHSELASCRDVELYLPKVNHNGYVWFDDVKWTTTQKAIAMIEARCERLKEGDDGSYRLYLNRQVSKEWMKG